MSAEPNSGAKSTMNESVQNPNRVLQVSSVQSLETIMTIGIDSEWEFLGYKIEGKQHGTCIQCHINKKGKSGKRIYKAESCIHMYKVVLFTVHKTSE